MKRWVLKNGGESPQIEGIRPGISRLLQSRGISSKEDAEEFLSDAPRKTYDPYLLKGMREAVERIKYHIDRGSRICIYGDYDVDGVTAICLLFEFLSNLTKNLMWYVPLRQEEGYGINKAAIDKIISEGAELMISVDCGIAGYEEVDYAMKKGLEVIVTDHHTVGDRIPDSIVINPKQPGCEYPFKELCGCGVAYKLIQALQRTYGLGKKTLKKGLDLVATATVADIVPLLDENRTLVKYGLKELNKRKRVGLHELIKAIGLDDKTIAASDIAFVIGPHINAGGRVDKAEPGLKLLLETDRKKAAELADVLVRNNNLRKSYQMEGFELARNYLNGADTEDLILVSGQEIHEGVAGIVAGKLKEEYHRPALIVTENKETGILKGTGRSIDSINLYDLLKTQEDLFLSFGGHKAACGFSFNCDKLPDFEKGLRDVLKKMREDNPTLMDEVLEIDGYLDLAEADNEFGWTIEKLEPFGQKNQRPVFVVRNVYIDDMKFVGKDREHCKFIMKDISGNSLECIMFNAESRFSGMDFSGKLFDFAGRINMNYRAGAYNIQFISIDFRRSM